jgi:hypothetical protein
MAMSNPNDPRIMPDLSNEEKDLFYNSMFRITDGLPSHDLQLIRSESNECEAALQKEIEILEAAIKAQDEMKISLDQPETGNETETPGTAPAAAPAPAPPAFSISTIPIIPTEYDSTKSTANKYLPTAERIVASELSSLDRYFAVSALLGRMREPLDTPPPPHSRLACIRLNAIAALEKKKNKNQASALQTRKIHSVGKYAT